MKASAPVTDKNSISAYASATETLAEGASMSDHFHTCHELILIDAGCAEFCINKKKYRVEPGSLVVIGSLEKHDMQIVSAPYRRRVLSVTDQFCLGSIREPALASFLLSRPPEFCHVIPLEGETYQAVGGLMGEILSECEDRQPFWELAAGLILERLLLTLFRARGELFASEGSSAAVSVFKLQRYIAEHYMESVTLDELAQRFFVSKYYLSHIFKRATGYGIQKYLQLYRINEAKRLLENSALPITEVCFAVGYSDINHFIRLFRRQEGIPPLQYRKRLRRERGG